MLPTQMAPDGAPATPIARSMAFGGVQVYPMMRAVRKSNGAECVIAERDFDPKIFSRIEDEDDAEDAPPSGAKKGAVKKDKDEAKPPKNAQPDGNGGFTPIVNSGYSRGELQAMSMEALRQLPEWNRIADKSALKTKDDFVLAILNVRTVQI